MGNAVILIVDDELLIRWSLRERLKQEGYEVIEAQDGAQAARHFSAGVAFAAVLLDYKLPDTDGLALLALLRQAQAHCPVIMMTAYGTADVQRKAHELGISGFVEKPFDYDALVGRVNAVAVR
ncbi:MAG: Sporulation initiation phosphotransferase F [Planctomycetes bacterium]|nr:Sporulation initiation phosphotransferase F [Planctomycetota bacterium]HRJ77049.1 response regulator [Planctomycetota bacterium]